MSLDDHIAAAFKNGTKSTEVEALIAEVEAKSAAFAETAEEADIIANSTVRSIQEKRDARQLIEEVTSKRERLQGVIADLREPRKEVFAEEADRRRWPAYEQVKTERDRLAAELADIYPVLAQRLANLLPRIAASDREVEYINAHALPSGAARLLVAELVARGLRGFFEGGEHTPRIVKDLRLPAWEHNTHEPFVWPRSR